MGEYKLIECVIDLMNNNDVRRQYSCKEQRIAGVIAAEIRHLNVVRNNVFEKLAKKSATCNIHNVMEEVFRDEVNLGRIIKAYGYIVYAVIHNSNGKDKVVDEFNDFYKKRLKPWLDSHDIWNEMYINTYPGLRYIL